MKHKKNKKFKKKNLITSYRVFIHIIIYNIFSSILRCYAYKGSSILFIEVGSEKSLFIFNVGQFFFFFLISFFLLFSQDQLPAATGSRMQGRSRGLLQGA
jgi:hypothetical protein